MRSAHYLGVFSINVASSPSARELFTRFDTGRFSKRFSAAGFISAASNPGMLCRLLEL
jgi:hypothetical protein